MLFESMNWDEYFGDRFHHCMTILSASRRLLSSYNDGIKDNLSKITVKGAIGNNGQGGYDSKKVARSFLAAYRAYKLTHFLHVTRNIDMIDEGQLNFALRLMDKDISYISELRKYSERIVRKYGPIQGAIHLTSITLSRIEDKMLHFFNYDGKSAMQSTIPELDQYVRSLKGNETIEEIISASENIEQEYMQNRMNSEKALNSKMAFGKINEVPDEYLLPSEYENHTPVLEVDNITWYNTHKTSCNAEARASGHCGTAPEGELFSLRYSETAYIANLDENITLLRPLVTAAISEQEHTMYQCRSNGNQKPSAKYHKAIVELLVKLRIARIARPDYEGHKTFNIMDLDENVRENLLKKNPALFDALDALINTRRSDVSDDEWDKMIMQASHDVGAASGGNGTLNSDLTVDVLQPHLSPHDYTIDLLRVLYPDNNISDLLEFGTRNTIGDYKVFYKTISVAYKTIIENYLKQGNNYDIVYDVLSAVRDDEGMSKEAIMSPVYKSIMVTVYTKAVSDDITRDDKIVTDEHHKVFKTLIDFNLKVHQSNYMNVMNSDIIMEIYNTVLDNTYPSIEIDDVKFDNEDVYFVYNLNSDYFYNIYNDTDENAQDALYIYLDPERGTDISDINTRISINALTPLLPELKQKIIDNIDPMLMDKYFAKDDVNKNAPNGIDETLLVYYTNKFNKFFSDSIKKYQ